MRVNIAAKLGIVLFFFLLFGILGCKYMTVLFGDPVFYRIEGEVYYFDENKGSDGMSKEKKIANAQIILSCPNQQVLGKTTSDEDGYFLLKGTGAPLNCQIWISHPEFQKAVIVLKPENREDTSSGFYIVWKLRVELKPWHGGGVTNQQTGVNPARTSE